MAAYKRGCHRARWRPHLGLLCMASISTRHRKNTTVVKRSIELARHKTSVSLENQFWEVLREIAHKRNIPIAVLIEQTITIVSVAIFRLRFFCLC